MMIPGSYLPPSSKVNAKLIRKTGFWIRWPVLSSDTEIEMSEVEFYKNAGKEDWTPARKKPGGILFKRIEGTNEFLEA